MHFICGLTVAAAVALIVYVLFLYPLILALTASRAHNPVRKDTKLRSVSVIIPVRNGEKFLERKLNSILSLNYPRELTEVIVVSDGSDDRTDEIAKSFAREGVLLVRIDRGGKCAALNAGVQGASSEILVFTDVRQKLDPNCLRNVIACFGEPRVGAVSAQLHIQSGETHEEQNTELYWKYELWIRQRMTKIDSTFGCSGCFYAIRRSLWMPIPVDVLLDDVWLPLQAMFKGFRLILEPTAKVYDFPTALESEFRRKVRTQAGLYQLLRIMPELMVSRNRMRFHFLSAKFGRLIIPFCLIALAVATLGLPPFFRTLLGLGQAGFYGLAALDPAMPAEFPLKRLTSSARTFVVLIAASLVAVRVYFVAPQTLWKETAVRKTSLRLE
jgi:cellulose synthase/poly-beta-1,6-N-acetylglucosamine synthase-like glycosyltransferase